MLCLSCDKNESIPKYIESDDISQVDVVFDDDDNDKNKVTI